MLFSLLYFLVGRVLGTGSRQRGEKDVDLLVLRHQLKVLQRQVKRPRLHRLDRLLLAAASRRCQEACGLRSSSGPRPCSAGIGSSSEGSGHIGGGVTPVDRRSTPRSAPSSSGWVGRIRGGATSASAESC